MNFPTFSHGRYAQDQTPRGQAIDFRVPLIIGGVLMRSGDIVFGDINCVCVVPYEGEVEIMTLAFEKACGEKLVKNAIEAGMGAKEAFEKFGIM